MFRHNLLLEFREAGDSRNARFVLRSQPNLFLHTHACHAK